MTLPQPDPLHRLADGLTPAQQDTALRLQHELGLQSSAGMYLSGCGPDLLVHVPVFEARDGNPHYYRIGPDGRVYGHCSRQP